MSTKPNYFKLGLFILLALFMLVVAIIMFGSGVFAKEKTFFESYFADPVTGLAPGSPVLEQGVQIGVVESISFVRHDYPFPEVTKISSPYRPMVRVICSIATGRFPEAEREETQQHLDALVKTGLRLQLSTNILTGQGYIEAGYKNPERFPVDSFPWEPEHLFIPSSPSDFTTMKDSVDRILHRLEQIETEKIADNINDLLKSVDKAVNDAQVGTLSKEASEFIEEIRQTNQSLKALLENPTPKEDLANVAELVDQMNLTLTRIDQLILARSPQVIEMLENFKQMSENLKNMTEDLKKNPSDLLFSQPPENKETLK
ncbi:MAG: MlaD family protein [Planctomycetota bacterium]|jgi:phospholipid/cholesterol/gamma-HCH transport system substrate-binding protein/paraquat-inducible protein B